MNPKNSICLWYDGTALEARTQVARFRVWGDNRYTIQAPNLAREMSDLTVFAVYVSKTLIFEGKKLGPPRPRG